MKKKIFITGGGGMLATEIESFYRSTGQEVKAPRIEELNVLDHMAVRESLTTFKPDYVFHTAALHVNDCEQNPEEAYKLNSWASDHLAKVCQETGSGLVYISSCGYFGDEIRYYSEYDQVVLKTIYAKAKYEGECLALRTCERTFAIRPGWLFGGSIKHQKNFVYQRYLEAKKKPVMQSAGDKYGSPTYTGDLVAKIDEILQTNHPGLYHVTNAGGGSRVEYVQQIMKSCALKNKVEAVDSSNFPRKANTPDCEMLHNWNLKYLGLKPMQPWQEAIDRFAKMMLKEINI
jgi:dTDP-4-dehydrorhamnose reductase